MLAKPAIDLPERSRILVVTLRRLGDVLLTTPLIHSLKLGIADCSIDALVFRGTEGMLAGNPDIENVIAVPEHSSPRESLTLLRRLWRRYDLAVPTQTGDRPAFWAWAAARRRAGFIDARVSGAWWKRRVFRAHVETDEANHRVLELLRLVDRLGLARRHEVVCPAGASWAGAVLGGRYAVLHANPKFRIRRWASAAWRELAGALAARGLSVIATGGAAADEKAYLDELWQGLEPAVVRLDGVLSWSDLTALLRGAAVYVGPDTSMTHLAAGAGAPTVALYGPASPSLIGPWPIGGLEWPWARAGTIQHRGNVWVVQNPLPCMPCDRLGCENHLESRSQCLDELPVQQVLAAVDQALTIRQAA